MASKKSPVKKIFLKLMLVCAGCSLLYIFWLPDVSLYAHKNPDTTAYIELRKQQSAAKGKKLKVRLDWRDLAAISPNLVHAVIIAEDEAFYHHHGIDWKEMRIALETDMQKRRFAYGGSTITQQLARNLYLSPSKNPLRKIKEALIARLLERKLGKTRILEIYLNVAEWGNGIFGAQSAANAYFGKSASDLSPEEAVALVSILPSPRKWSPFSSGRKLENRRDNILMRMYRSGYLTDEAAALLADTQDTVLSPATSGQTTVPVSTGTVSVP